MRTALAAIVGTRRGRLAAALASAVLLAAAGAKVVLDRAVQAAAPIDTRSAGLLSSVVVDREDRLLRAYTTQDGKWRLPVEVKEVDPRYLAMLFAFEDRRFRAHRGVDWRAFARAAVQAVRHRRLVSGGSTLTMQVARLLDGRHERTAAGKLRQTIRALALERQLGKNEILAVYLRLAPFGGNLEGVRAAALAYFGKEPQRLSAAEAALLVALPQSPEARRPDRSPHAARRARDRVLDVAAAAGILPAAEVERAKAERVPHERREFPKLAPHLADAEIAAAPATRIHRLTIDRTLQSGLETLATDHAKALGTKLSAAILALDHTTGEVLGYVGSAGYLDATRFGAVDMVQATRSPGSTLKPIVYGLGFEQGVIHPETLIEDRPARFGAYTPKNFDEAFHGTVTVREALAQSLNIPAVKVLDAVGPQRLVARFRKLGLAAALPDDAEPSLAVALGGIGLKMHDLAALYAALARGGEAVDLFWRREAAVRPRSVVARPRTALAPVAAWYVTDILKDAPPPPAAAGGRIAYKTGTSYGYRDAWAIGYDGRHVIAVWVGRPDATATPGLSGRTAAAPILFDAFARLGGVRAGLPGPPSGALRVAAAELPPPLKRFHEPGAAAPSSPFIVEPLAIAFPPDRAVIEHDTADDDALVFKAEGGTLPLTWLVDGAPVASDPRTRDVAFQPAGPGFVQLSVIDASGRAQRVTVRIK